jgi:hypothetical protein
MLTGVPITADGMLDWRPMQKDRPADYKSAAAFLWREALWVECKAKLVARLKGGATPYPQRTHAQSYQEEFVNDYDFAGLRGDVDVDRQSTDHQHHRDEDDDDHGDDDDRDDLDVPAPTDAHWDDIRSELPTWVCQAARTYNSKKGMWRPWLSRFVESRIKDFLNEGKRDPKGDAKRDEPVVAGMVDRLGEGPDIEQQVYGWIAERDLEGIFLVAEVEVALDVDDPEDRAMATELLTAPRFKYVDLGKPHRMNGDQSRKRMRAIFKKAPALKLAADMVKLTVDYISEEHKDEKGKLKHRLAGLADAVRIYYSRHKHQTPAFRQGQDVHYTRTEPDVKTLTHLMNGRVAARCPFQHGAWTGSRLSFTPELLPPRGGKILVPSCWYPDKPQAVAAPVRFVAVRITDPAAPLHRFHADAHMRTNTDPQFMPEHIERQHPFIPAHIDRQRYPSSYVEELAQLCRERWNAEINALAPVIGWKTVEPGNYGESCARRMDLNERADPQRVLLKLKNKDAHKHFERQIAAGDARDFIGPIVDVVKLVEFLPDHQQVVRRKLLRAERHWPQRGNCGRWADDDNQGGPLEAELAFRIKRRCYSTESISKCKQLITERKGRKRTEPRGYDADMYVQRDHWTLARDPAPGEAPAYRRPLWSRNLTVWPPCRTVDEDFSFDVLDERYAVPLPKHKEVNEAPSKFLLERADELRLAVVNLARGICWHTWLGQIQFQQFGKRAFTVCRCQYCEDLNRSLNVTTPMEAPQ